MRKKIQKQQPLKASLFQQKASESEGKLNFIDLFCGCGGFTLGMERAGYQCLAAIDSNAEAVATLQANLPHIEKVLQRDLTAFSPKELADIIGTNHVDVIIGGPPCQGFSTARQVDGANHGIRLTPDSRRHLYREFLKFVGFFNPSVFVMENVIGIKTAAKGEYFTKVQAEARALGYRVHGQIEDAWELGVPQKRRRQLFIGVRADLPGYFIPEIKPSPRAEARILLGATIGDLPIIRAGSGEDERDYDMERRSEHFKQHGEKARNYLVRVLEISHAVKLTNHVARPHNERDLRDFARLREGENSATALRDRNVKFEFPYDKSSFKDRYTRQSRWKPCSTIVAHLSKDGLMFIHPTQNRSLTPREAARIQSFPDWFRFPVARTHAFRLIGNAVPPLVGEAVGLTVKEFLETMSSRQTPFCMDFGKNKQIMEKVGVPARTIRHVAEHKLQYVAQLDRHNLRTLPNECFLGGWHALLLLLPELHPYNAIDHGHMTEYWPDAHIVLPTIAKERRLRYARSGWPVALELVGNEAWRRYRAGELSEHDFYFIKATTMALRHHSASFLEQNRFKGDSDAV